jgi:signal transduction histidine kinase
MRREGRNAVFMVRDRGIGIPEQDRQWLFHPFHRGQNVGQRSGTGLGLVIVQRCLDLHRGEIQVESAVGAGTTMTVRLPVFDVAPAALTAQRAIPGHIG